MRFDVSFDNLIMRTRVWSRFENNLVVGKNNDVIQYSPRCKKESETEETQTESRDQVFPDGLGRQFLVFQTGVPSCLPDFVAWMINY